MLRRTVLLLTTLCFMLPLAAIAEDANPPLPDTLQSLAAKGAQIRYLGREKGLDGWIAVQNGQEQYFYATPDREAIIMGLLFDKSGTMITVRQVQNLQKGNDPTIESLLTGDATAPTEDSLTKLQQELSEKAKVPESEKFFKDIEQTNWITLGSDKAPVVYAFLDPQCPHCQSFMKDIRKNFIDAGALQVRMIPVGFSDETKAQAAFLLAATNAKDLFYKHLDGDEKALPVNPDINKQAIESNLGVMQQWKLDATPIIVYRSSKGEVKIVRGRPKNPSDILNDVHG